MKPPFKRTIEIETGLSELEKIRLHNKLYPNPEKTSYKQLEECIKLFEEYGEPPEEFVKRLTIYDISN